MQLYACYLNHHYLDIIARYRWFQLLFVFICVSLQWDFFPGVCWIITRMCKNRNQPRTVAQLILTVPHTQEFLSPVHCINMVYILKIIELRPWKQGLPPGNNYAILFIKIYKLQVLHLNCSTRDGNKEAKFTLLCHISTSMVHKISLKSHVRRISPYDPFSLALFQCTKWFIGSFGSLPNVMVNYSVVRFTWVS